MPPIKKNSMTATLCAFLILALVASPRLMAGQAAEPQENAASLTNAITALQEQVRQQQEQIDKLTDALKKQQQEEPNGAEREKPSSPSDEATAAPVTQEELGQYTAKVEQLDKKLDTTTSNLGGFKLSGDFRYRLDGQFRGGNSVAPPLQNVRSRYRVR